MYSYSSLDTRQLEEMLGLVIATIAVGGLVLSILGVVFAVRTWLAQKAMFEARKDIAEVKSMLQEMTPSRISAPPASPRSGDGIVDGPKIAGSSNATE